MKRTRFDDAMLGATAFLSAVVAAAGVSSEAPASHDAETVRTVGLGFTGAFHGLSVLVSAPTMLVPLGTRALRASLASALVAAVCAGVAYEIARVFVARAVPPRLRQRAGSDKLASAVAAVGVLTTTLAPAWQAEASAPGGAVVSALVILAALALAQRMYSARIAPLAFVFGLAASEGPWVLVAAALAALPWAERALRRPRKAETLDAALAFALGLAPLGLALALARRPPELALFSTADPASGSALAFAKEEIGVLVLAFGAAGAALAALVASPNALVRAYVGRERVDASTDDAETPSVLRMLLSLGGAVLAGALAIGAASASHASGPVLAGIVALGVLAAVGLASAVAAIAQARVPFARASAALVVVLELVLPVQSADATTGKREARSPRGASTWNEVAWGSAPPAAVVLVTDRVTMRRIAAARATGDLRGDLLVVPAFDLDARQARRALAAEPKLAGLYRDVALGSPPEELSLAQLAAERPVLAAFDPRWDHALARHLVPSGLSALYESEPRGASDRKKALDAFGPSKDRLVRVAVPKRDPELAASTATLLRARAIGMAACGEKEILSHALDDLRPFALPDDRVATLLVRRMLTSKGGIDVKDLAP